MNTAFEDDALTSQGAAAFGDFEEVNFDEQYEGVDPNADLTDQPPPPLDGEYRAVIFVDKPDNKSDIRAGYEFKGQAIRPSTTDDKVNFKTDDKGKINGTLYLKAKIFDSDGKVVAFDRPYAFTYVGQNGTSPALSLAKGLGLDLSSPSAIKDLVVTHTQSGLADPGLLRFGKGSQLLNLLLLDAMRVLIEAKGEAGYELPAVQVQTDLEAPSGKKTKDGKDEYEVKIKTSKKIIEQNHWPRPDESKIPKAKLVTKVISFTPKS